MARLPIIGRDNGAWGDILNEFLLAAHNDDGTLKRDGDIDSLMSSMSDKYTKPVNGIPFGDLASNVQNALLKADSAVVIVPATLTSQGTIRLAGDLGGTADAPTTPTAVHLDGAETITGVKTFVVAPLVPDGAFSQSAVVGLTADLYGINTSLSGVTTDLGALQTDVAGLATGVSNKASLSSPTFTGTPSAPTAAAGTSTNQIATTAFVESELASHDVANHNYVDARTTVNYILPSQDGNAGKYLTTNGTSTSWSSITQSAIAPFSLTAYGATFSPAKSTTYYFGSLWNVAPSTSANFSRLYIPRSGIIKKAFVFCNQAIGTAETSTLSIRLNNTTNTVVSSSIINNVGATNASNTALSIAVNEGDYVELKWDTPAWTTNPTNVRISVTLYME